MLAVRLHPPHALTVEQIPAPAAPGPGEVLVDISYGGICGSDLHYYHHGGFGSVRVAEPMALGHEVSGVVAALGPDVQDIAVGTKVAVNPSRPCGTCTFCAKGHRNECLDMRFNGSAMRTPHEQGLFRAQVVVPAQQAVALPQDADLTLAALAEPLAVCLHAVSRAGPLTGKTVLISGAGPIGCLTLVAARHAGATRIIVTDLSPAPLAIARELGADQTIDLTVDAAALEPLRADKGKIDVAFECSGAAPALASACEVLIPGGLLVMVGLGTDPVIPASLVVTKELSLIGTFRFDAEFHEAARLIGEGVLNLRPLITGIHPASQAPAAFEEASDKKRAMKVQLNFTAS